MGSSINYDNVRNDLKEMMEDPNWDDGTYAPLFIRLAWHSSGTYSKEDVNLKGGSNGATMRFSPEKDDPENVGLEHARKLLEPIKQKHAGLAYSDLWILAAYVALEVTGGPVIEFHPGRQDKVASEAVAPGRLPEAEFGLEEGVDSEGRINGWENLAQHVRDVFYRMGFNDREIVALLCGGHVYGRCHPNLTGYAGAWVEEPTKFSNEYAADMLEDEWMYVQNDTKVDGELVPEETRPAPGKRQYMTKWSPANRIDNRGSSNFPPGKYKVTVDEDDWINVRRTHLVDSAVIDQPKNGTELMVLSTREFGAGVRGQIDVGGWVSIVNSQGDEKLMERIGDLEMLAAKYRILPEVTKFAYLYDEVPKTAADAKAKQKGNLKAKEVQLSKFEVVEGENNLNEIYGKIQGGDNDGSWVLVLSSEAGAVFERIKPGYNDTPRKAVGARLNVKYQMMLPSDMVLLWDEEFKKHLEVYAEDEDTLKKDFGEAYKKLTELGVPGCPGFKP